MMNALYKNILPSEYFEKNFLGASWETNIPNLIFSNPSVFCVFSRFLFLIVDGLIICVLGLIWQSIVHVVISDTFKCPDQAGEPENAVGSTGWGARRLQFSCRPRSKQLWHLSPPRAGEKTLQLISPLMAGKKPNTSLVHLYHWQ